MSCPERPGREEKISKMSLRQQTESLVYPASLKNRSGRETQVCDSTLLLPKGEIKFDMSLKASDVAGVTAAFLTKI